MAFDYKKEYKEFYLPPKKPVAVRVPPMNMLRYAGMAIRMTRTVSISGQSEYYMLFPIR